MCHIDFLLCLLEQRVRPHVSRLVPFVFENGAFFFLYSCMLFVVFLNSVRLYCSSRTGDLCCPCSLGAFTEKHHLVHVYVYHTFSLPQSFLETFDGFHGYPSVFVLVLFSHAGLRNDGKKSERPT